MVKTGKFLYEFLILYDILLYCKRLHIKVQMRRL